MTKQPVIVLLIQGSAYSNILLASFFNTTELLRKFTKFLINVMTNLFLEGLNIMTNRFSNKTELLREFTNVLLDAMTNLYVNGIMTNFFFNKKTLLRHFTRVRHTTSTLTLNVRGPSYLGLTRSISCLLMPWFLTSPGHQQSWYWLYRICRSLSYLRKDYKYLRYINVEEWHKM